MRINSHTNVPAVVERFLRYVRIDTQSDASSDTVPSTEKQKNLSCLLVNELREMGYPNAFMDEYGYVFCSIHRIRTDNSQQNQAVLGLLAHLDTAPDESGENVHPVVHPPYQGGVIQLPGDTSVRLDPERSPGLLNHLGERIISSDGTTLLGSDDKAGVAILMQLAEDLLHDDKTRPEIRLCFTIDEEIGRGVEHMDLGSYGADVAYTLDGGSINTISFETFHAVLVQIDITGRSVHPGYAKDILVNAMRIAAEIVAALPVDEAPETTELREGYLHPYHISDSNVTQSTLQIIIRDFSDEGMDQKKQLIHQIVEEARTRHADARIQVVFTEQYRNMRSYIEQLDFRTVTFARKAAQKMGFTLKEELVRGGTDGARLSERGLPTPNIFNGGYDYHSRFEWNTVENLEHALAYSKELVRYWGEHG